ncbi:hypothetical protein M2H13_18745 [Vibrio vulnificus]|nr:hypothetical protein [Vibrio vulnificus]EJA3293417.1 hypothetical protein [Vibrio vulnificus]EJA3297111.1 hypothetical protein [Vibrio vulnificus]MCU8163190.1 hypothetical protein [Vibrio vulnificus]
MKILKYLPVVLAIFLCSCAKPIGKSDLEKLIYDRDFVALLASSDKYISDNSSDEFGYYAKATALIYTRADAKIISLNIDKAFNRSPNHRIRQYALAMSVMLLQNGYCNESLPVAARMGFDLNNASSSEYILLSVGYVDCLALKDDRPADEIIGIYKRLTIATGYDHELTESYVKYLIKKNMVKSAREVVYNYERYKPKSEYLSELLK